MVGCHIAQVTRFAWKFLKQDQACEYSDLWAVQRVQEGRQQAVQHQQPPLVRHLAKVHQWLA